MIRADSWTVNKSSRLGIQPHVWPRIRMRQGLLPRELRPVLDAPEPLLLYYDSTFAVVKYDQLRVGVIDVASRYDASLLQVNLLSCCPNPKSYRTARPIPYRG